MLSQFAEIYTLTSYIGAIPLGYSAICNWIKVIGKKTVAIFNLYIVRKRTMISKIKANYPIDDSLLNCVEK